MVILGNVLILQRRQERDWHQVAACVRLLTEVYVSINSREAFSSHACNRSWIFPKGIFRLFHEF